MSDSIREGNLHNWFSKSKSKDGKPGWVQSDGSPCANEPGETKSPKCYSSQRLAGLKKTAEGRKKIRSADARKSREDPGQQQKSGAAKPTMVRTFKDPKDYKKHKSGDYTPKKMKKEQFSNWRDDFVATEHEFIDIITPEPMEGLSETKEGLMKAGREQYKKEKEEGRYGGTKPSNERVAKLMKKLKEEEKWPSIKDKDAPHKKLVKKPNKKYKDSPHGDFYAPSIKEEKKESERKDAMPAGDVGYDIHKKAVAQYNKQNPSKKVKEEVDTLDEAVPAVIAAVGKGAMKMATNMAKAKAKDMAIKKAKSMVTSEEVVSEADKKGAGSGKKDACYHKVKASAKVWPSAYASGRLVQCRKKGASNYGSGSKNEEFSSEGYKGKHGQSDKEYMDSRSDAGKQISGDSKMSGAAYSHRSFKGQGEPAKPGERQKAQGKMTQADRDELAIRKSELKKREEKKKEKVEEAIKCWKGYKRKKGAAPGSPGSCVKEEKKPMPIGKMVRKAKGKVEKYQDLQSKADALRKRANKDGRKAEKGTRHDAAMKSIDAEDRHSSALMKERKVGELKNQAIKVLETAKKGTKKKGTKSERFSDWRGDLNLMEGVSAWQRRFISEDEKTELQKKASRGDKAAMKKLKELRAAGKIGKEPGFEPKRDLPEGAAWTRKEGKNEAGGLNEKGRKSYERENPGSDLKAPQPEGGSRKKSFCARMSGMKKKLTSKKTANDPDSRINKSLRKWKC